MLPDRVSNPGPLTYESGALPIALRGPAKKKKKQMSKQLRSKVIQNQHYTESTLLLRHGVESMLIQC